MSRLDHVCSSVSTTELCTQTDERAVRTIDSSGGVLIQKDDEPIAVLLSTDAYDWDDVTRIVSVTELRNQTEEIIGLTEAISGSIVVAHDGEPVAVLLSSRQWYQYREQRQPRQH